MRYKRYDNWRTFIVAFIMEEVNSVYLLYVEGPMDTAIIVDSLLILPNLNDCVTTKVYKLIVVGDDNN